MKTRFRLDCNHPLARELEARLNNNPEELAEGRKRLLAMRPLTNATKDTVMHKEPSHDRDELKRRMGLPAEPPRIHWDPNMRTTRVFPACAQPTKQVRAANQLASRMGLVPAAPTKPHMVRNTMVFPVQSAQPTATLSSMASLLSYSEE